MFVQTLAQQGLWFQLGPLDTIVKQKNKFYRIKSYLKLVKVALINFNNIFVGGWKASKYIIEGQ